VIEKIIAEHLDIDISEVTDEKHLIDDLGADSLHTVELIMEFENEFDIEIPDDDAETLVTVGKIKEYISENT
jgi:acyl carrier protein